MADVCERIIWSGGGAEASWGEVTPRGALATPLALNSGPAYRITKDGMAFPLPTAKRNVFVHCECMYVRVFASERAYNLYLNFGTTSALKRGKTCRTTYKGVSSRDAGRQET